MKMYTYQDFDEKDGWLLFRIKTGLFLQQDPEVSTFPEVYALMDLPSGFLFGTEVALEELTSEQLDKLLKAGLAQKGKLPSRLMIAVEDPAAVYLHQFATRLQLKFESAPMESFEELTAPVNETFNRSFSSASSSFEEEGLDMDQDEDFRCAIQSIPDSYDLCPCASEKKYKFCCKKIFTEITEAMVAAENSKIEEALNWIAKAEKIVGRTAEILCRKSIVYSFCDSEKSEELLEECLTINPNHPRAHYLRGIQLKEEGDFENAILAYETAIKNYPKTDKYHLNEAYNNLGVLFYDMGDITKAKAAWKQALHYMPSDKLTKQNLRRFGNGF